MSIEQMMEHLRVALPSTNRRGYETIREVCLTLYNDGTWSAMAGGHSAVHIGEYGGDFDAEGPTAEAALINCLKVITK